MAADFNLTNQYISESFQQLMQISGSIPVDGTGSVITNLDVTSSHALTASYAVTQFTSSYADVAGVAFNSNNLDGRDSSTFASTGSNTFNGSQNIIGAATASSGFKGDLDGNAATATTASHAISALTASYALTSAPQVSSSYANFATSASHAINADTALSASYVAGNNVHGPVLDSVNATSASHAINSDLAITASHALSVDATAVTGSVTNAEFAEYANNTIVYGKNLSGGIIAKGTPLYFTGSGTLGNIVGVYPADASNPLRMPAAGVAGEQLAIGAEGKVFLDGFLNGVDTSAFNSGDAVYVAVGGGYTNIKPTGSANLIQALGYVEKSDINGSGVIQGSGRANDVPNITTNYLWLGNSNGVATAVNSASLKVTNADSASYADGYAKLSANNIFTGNTQTFQNIAVNGTGSFAYLQQVTGSAKVIGDAFLILNADSPSQRYAGLSVYDSGSVPIATSSLWWDGVTNDWKYQYSSSATHEAAVALFGPEMSDISGALYPSANTILKGNGNHHVTDSNLQDDGSKIYSNLPFSSSAGFTGSLHGNALTATTATVATTANFATSAATASLASTASLALDSQLLDGKDSTIFATTGSNTFTGKQTINTSYVEQNFSAPGTNQEVAFFNVNGSVVNSKNYNRVFFGQADYPSFGVDYEDYFAIEYYDGFGYNFGTEFSMNGKGARLVAVPSGSGFNKRASVEVQDNYNGTSTFNAFGDLFFLTGRNSVQIGDNLGNTIKTDGSGVQITGSNGVYIKDETYVDATINTRRIHFDKNPFNSTVTNNLGAIRLNADGKTYTNTLYDQSMITSQSVHGMYIDTGSNTLEHYLQTKYSDKINELKLSNVGSARTINVDTDNFVITGSVNSQVSNLSIASLSASMDFNNGNFFNLTLANGVDTHLDATNIRPGQTITLRVTNNATAAGTLSFSPDFKFTGGVKPVVTATTNAVDILTFVTTDTTNVYGTSLLNFS